jgi:coatomer subunit beta
MEVHFEAMSVVLSMMSSRNVEQVALFLKKLLQKIQETDSESVGFVARLSISCCT